MKRRDCRDVRLLESGPAANDSSFQVSAGSTRVNSGIYFYLSSKSEAHLSMPTRPKATRLTESSSRQGSAEQLHYCSALLQTSLVLSQFKFE